jgi:ferric-dicitrate binding protein FerR (iron transport regulator)
VGRLLIKPAIAFALLVMVAVASQIWLNRTAPATYATSRGEHATINLPDSSVVMLNYMTQLTVEPPASGNRRAVRLTGEAFFRVRHDGSPFVVNTPLGSISVLGTEFNVMANEDRLEVEVVSGSVRLDVSRNGKDSSVVLTASEIATCPRGGFPEKPAPVPFPVYPGWLHGRMNFYRTTLSAACREMDARFGVTVRAGDAELEQETITGSVGDENLQAALSTLAKLTGTQIKHENGAYILY